MAILVRRMSKTLLFVGLFFLVVRYVYAPLSFIQSWNQHYIFVVGWFLGFHDIDLFEVVVGVTVSLICTTAIYVMLVKTCRSCCARHKATASRGEA
jgi:hypothetical protein